MRTKYVICVLIMFQMGIAVLIMLIFCGLEVRGFLKPVIEPDNSTTTSAPTLNCEQQVASLTRSVEQQSRAMQQLTATLTMPYPPQCVTESAPSWANKEFITCTVERAVTAAIAQTVKDIPNSAQRLIFIRDITRSVSAAVNQAMKDLTPLTSPRFDSDEHVASSVAPCQQFLQNLTKSEMERVTQLTAPTTLKPTLTPTSPHCVSGFEYSDVTERCYKLHPEEVRWQVADEACRGEGGLLAVINSNEEARVLTDINRGARNNCFIGVYKDSAGRWTTVTGEDVVAAAGHDVWRAGEPWNGEQWRYGELYDDDTIGTRTEDYTRPFICERAAV